MATAAEKVAEAKALQEAYYAEKEAELERAAREKATQEADVIVTAEVQKQKLEIEAEAIAEQSRRIAKGEADAIYAKMEAQARGAQEILLRQAEGLQKIVGAAGGDTNNAVRLLIADKLEELTRIQVDAIKNIKIDKVTVWDNGSKDGSGKTGTADFMSGLFKSIPPLNEVFKMAGMELPDFTGKVIDNKSDSSEQIDMSEKVETSSEVET